jgi:hypothetical protein
MSREIVVADSLEYLKKVSSLPNVVTGICDQNETDMSMPQYLQFFKDIASLIFTKLDKSGYAIFIQTDRKHDREWMDKSYMLTELAYSHGLKMVWHKIVLHRPLGSTNLYRPCYAHMLCYTYTGKPGAAFSDVLPVSEKLYENGTPLGAAEAAVKFIKDNNKKSTLIVDPFVGRGTVVAIANRFGLDAIGIDIDPKQAAMAQTYVI